MLSPLSGLFGSANERILKSLRPLVAATSSLAQGLRSCSAEDLRDKFATLRRRRQGGATQGGAKLGGTSLVGASLEHLLPETFALVREAATRTLGQTHFDVQLAGGIVLHRGEIAEMKTGEGKTLVATLAAALNALDNQGVHIVTVNDYLARRDADWMGKVFHALGLTTGCIHANLDDSARKAQYACDITYGTNNELGFDFLRDNLKLRSDDCVQRGFNYAIVDEVDSILIDEARTPLIISGPAQRSVDTYSKIDKLVAGLSAEHFEKDEKQRSISLTESGSEYCESLVEQQGLVSAGGLYDLENITLVHQITQGLKARHLFHIDSDYIVKDGAVLIIDEFTGRIMEGRRYSDGLHQALEAKEGVVIQNENQTLASITFQNYFRGYAKLAGMTGTAMTEAAEFDEIYGLRVVALETHKPMCRKDDNDEIYRTREERDKAVERQIESCFAKGQPILIGTVSIDKSERLSARLRRAKIPHQVLNARRHEQEAEIIVNAGRSGSVTIATNMAGRGTDIQLGGNAEALLALASSRSSGSSKNNSKGNFKHSSKGNFKNSSKGKKGSAKNNDAKNNDAKNNDAKNNEAKNNDAKNNDERLLTEIRANAASVRAAGGLFILGTERHESRRIDNQLRGRSGRQGDAGRSKFFLSLEDDLMRVFGSQRLDSMLEKLGIRADEAISHPWVSKAIEKAQKKVEEQNFEIRKQLLKFDDVTNDQRKIVFAQRRAFMDDSVSQSSLIAEFREDLLEQMVKRALPERALAEQWDLSGLHEETLRLFALDLPIARWAHEEGVAEDILRTRIGSAVSEHVAAQFSSVSRSIMEDAERYLLLQVQDALWKDHLGQLDHLRQGIGLRSYGQQDPLNAYRREAFELFEGMLLLMKENVVALLSRLTIDLGSASRQSPDKRSRKSSDTRIGGTSGEENVNNSPNVNQPLIVADKIRRNAACPCGSGKKYKHCHGKLS